MKLAIIKFYGCTDLIENNGKVYYIMKFVRNIVFEFISKGLTIQASFEMSYSTPSGMLVARNRNYWNVYTQTLIVNSHSNGECACLRLIDLGLQFKNYGNESNQF